MLTPDEARANFRRLRADLDKLEAACEPDDDGKVRITDAEAREILRDLPGNATRLVIDIID